MKTGMEWPLAALLAVFLAIMAFVSWTHTQGELATARVSILAAGEQLPPVAIPLAELATGWIVNAVFGVILTGAALALAAKAWRAWKKGQGRNKWQSGPNANYQQRAPQVRPPGDSEIMRLLMYQQLMAQNRPGTRMMVSQNENEPDDSDFAF
jgi:cbb3-type cytochrome oxidase subunit 3